MRRFLLLLFVQIACAYTDPEIEHLLKCISNPYNPSIEDYRLIESYFLYGNRPYLETMRKNTHIPETEMDFRIQQLRNFKLVCPCGEMPVFEIYASHVTEETKDRCIIIYASYNRYYPQRARRLFEELKECGYSGHILLRIGGIPNIAEGGARLSTIPYTWRVNLFKEARSRGFTKILYLDGSLHPLSDLSQAFKVMDETGLFSCTTGDWPRDDYIEYIRYVGIPDELKDQIPWIYGHTIGLNFNQEKVRHLFDEWDRQMHRMEDFCSMGDDVLFACLAWAQGFRPSFSFDEIIELYDFPPPSPPPSLLLYQDNHRLLIRSGWSPAYD